MQKAGSTPAEANYNPVSDSKKEAFRKYMESSGVVDSLTKVLVQIYEEPNKPSSAIEYIKQALGAPTAAEYDALIAEKEELQAKYDELLAKCEALEARGAVLLGKIQSG
eukprot:jgi/Mesvir1/12899/Mv05925-RA.1